MPKTSDHGDLTQLAKDIEAVFEDHGFGDPAMAVAFTLPDDRSAVNYVTNVHRLDGIRLFAATAQKMQAKAN